MSWTATFVLLGAALGFGLYCAWRGSRPPDPRRGPRLLPWRMMMVLSAAVALLALVHAVNLLGVTTGR